MYGLDRDDLRVVLDTVVGNTVAEVFDGLIEVHDFLRVVLRFDRCIVSVRTRTFPTSLSIGLGPESPLLGQFEGVFPLWLYPLGDDPFDSPLSA